MRLFLLTLLISINLTGIAQQNNANSWADSVYKSLSNDERIAQLIVTRLSSMDVKTKKITFLYDQVAELVKKYNIGGVCVFQGSPVLQAGYLNNLQAMAKTPILVSIDAEWGVGMRIIDSVAPLPKQMMLGAVKDATIIYRYGQIVAEQCKRMGIQMNYAPVMDVNNNPENPVINDRSFGEDKYKVALFGTQYMKGMQESGVMACAKHFPGHGDVAVDSHYDLPVINKSMTDLDSLEMYPFRQIFKEGVGSVMIAHLFIPSIDKRKNRPTSLSASNIKELMRSRIGYQGLTITDGLEMQGVKKFFPDGESSVESLIAGNDLLCLPDNIPLVIKKIKEAIDKKRLSWEEIEQHCKKVLRAKYEYGLTQLKPINTENLTADLNKDIPAMRRLVAENAITLLSKKDSIFFPLKSDTTAVGEVAYVGVGLNTDNAFAARMRRDHKATVYYFDYSKKKQRFNADDAGQNCDAAQKNNHRYSQYQQGSG
jgi:beta-N-acetylhexosaminidase